MANFFDTELFRVVVDIVGAASVFAATIPKPRTSRVLKTLRGILDVLAFNWGHARQEGQ